MGHDPIWLAVLLAVNLQTSFLTPPFGFSLFYLRGAAPKEVTTGMIYRGVAPFIALQILAIGIIWWVPLLATWLPRSLF
jgi:TRAP-type mannitol/chloroaromatic compound transport system permease large subunit